MAYPKFEKTGNTHAELTFNRGRTLDSGERYEPRQSRTESGAGYIQTADLGRATRYIDCNFHGLSSTIYNQLVEFLQDPTVRWSGKYFTFVDEDEVEYDVYYEGPMLKKSPMKNQDVDVDILLRVKI